MLLEWGQQFTRLASKCSSVQLQLHDDRFEGCKKRMTNSACCQLLFLMMHRAAGEENNKTMPPPQMSALHSCPFAVQLARFASQDFIQACSTLLFSLLFLFYVLLFSLKPHPPPAPPPPPHHRHQPPPPGSHHIKQKDRQEWGVDQNDWVENHTTCTDVKIRMWRKTMTMAAVGKQCKQ